MNISPLGSLLIFQIPPKNFSKKISKNFYSLSIAIGIRGWVTPSKRIHISSE